MADSAETTRLTVAQQPWLDAMTRDPKRSAYVFFVLAAAFAAIPITLGVMYRTEYLFVCILGGVLSAIALVAGIFQMLREPHAADPGELDNTRLFILTVGGLLGFVGTLLAVALAVHHWTDYFAAGFETWRAHWGYLFVTLLCLFGGMAIMFASLQLAQADARSNVGLRRLLYGYTAVLSLLLLIAILLLVNLLPYVPMKPFSRLAETYDWTEASIYSLSPASRNILENLDKPLKVYAIMPLRDEMAQREVNTLLSNCASVVHDPRNFEVKSFSPDLDRDELRRVSDELRKVAKDFALPSDEPGLLLVYGTDPNVSYEFVKMTDMFSQEPDRSGGSQSKFLFKGEDALITKLNYLTEGKTKSVIYFTQGNGELDMNDSSTPERGIGRLKDQLQRSNYEVKELKFGPESAAIPPDAAVIVIARPTTPLSEPAINALRSYVNGTGDSKKKGKLIVLLDVVTTPEGEMVKTGLEPLLAEYSVQVGSDHIVCVQGRGNLDVFAVTNPTSNNPAAKAFNNEQTQYQFYFNDVRTVKPSPAGPQGPGRFVAEPLLLVPGQLGVWTETNLRASPTAQVAELLKPENRDKLRARISPEPLSIAVTVGEPSAPDANDPHAFMRQPGKDQQPRMVVFGDAGWVSNRAIGSERGRDNSELFTGALAWLRERPSLGQVAEAKERKVFELKVDPDVASRLFWVPGPLMLLGIVGLGLGVWVVRRR
jgi:hypothetical protein